MGDAATSLLPSARPPCAARGPAQQKAVPVIGCLSSGSPGPSHRLCRVPPGLSETGYVEGKTCDRIPLGGGQL